MNRKPIFDIVRRLLGRGFAPDEVEALDRAIDAAAPLESANSRTIGLAGATLIRNWESCARRLPDGRVAAYPDPGSADGRPWTIGWGSTGPEIGPDTVWTQAECDARFARDLERYADEVSAAVEGAPTTQNQFDALVSFHYNTGAIRRATLTRKHRAGDHAGAQAEFGKWVHASGKVLRGLVSRRAEEAALYARLRNPSGQCDTCDKPQPKPQ